MLHKVINNNSNTTLHEMRMFAGQLCVNKIFITYLVD